MGVRSAFALISAVSVVVGGTLCGAAPQPGSAWEARFGLTSPGFQQLFNQLVGQGYRLVDVSGYAVGGQDRYAAIWEQSSGPSWQSRHGLSSSQYQQTFDSLLAQGYRLVQVSGYGLNNTDLYAAIWQRSSGPAWEARHGLTSGQFQQTFDQLVARGYRLVDTSAYTVGGRDLHAGIWEKRNGPAWESRSGLTSDQYQQTFDSLVGQGYRLIDVSGYNQRPGSLRRDLGKKRRPYLGITSWNDWRSIPSRVRQAKAARLSPGPCQRMELWRYGSFRRDLAEALEPPPWASQRFAEIHDALVSAKQATLSRASQG